MSVTAIKLRYFVEFTRGLVQDLLVPELKSLESSVESLRSEMHTNFVAVRTERKLRDELQTEATKHLTESMKSLGDKLDRTLEVRERLASIEARLPKT